MISRSARITLAISGLRTFKATTRPSQHDRAVDLRDRGGRHRRLFDRRKNLRERPPIFLAQDRLDLGERKRSHIIPQRGQLVGVRLWQQIGPRAEQLPSFTKVGPRSSQTSRSRRARSCGGNLAAQRNPLERADNPLEMECSDHVLITITHQAGQDLPVTWQVSQMADRFSNHRLVLNPSKNATGRTKCGAGHEPPFRIRGCDHAFGRHESPASSSCKFARFWLNYPL